MILPGVPDPTRVGPGRWQIRTDSSWNQGPGLYGGLLAALLVRAAEREGPGWPVRAFSIHLCATTPPGLLEVELVEQRRGTHTLFYAARLLSRGQPTVIGSVTLGRARPTDLDLQHGSAPSFPAPGRLPDALGEGVRPPGIPTFTKHFDFRVVQGPPFAGAPRAETGGWLRTRRPHPLDGALVAALSDAWPLALLAHLPAPRPVASVAIHTQILHPLPANPDDAFYAAQVRTDVNREGYGDQRTSLFDPAGRLLARSTQLVAVIR